jgi:hypothetical protein
VVTTSTTYFDGYFCAPPTKCNNLFDTILTVNRDCFLKQFDKDEKYIEDLKEETAVCDTAPCSLAEVDRRFRGMYACIIRAIIVVLSWMQYASLKSLSSSTILQHAVSQKASVFIFVAVRT